MKYLLLFITVLILSCSNNTNENNISNIIIKNEIEPNNTIEYSQFIDADTHINAGFNNSSDIDYYHISPTNGFAMDFNISIENKDAAVQLELLNSSSTLLKLNTKDILNYDSVINLKDILFENTNYFLKLTSDSESKYELKFTFKNNFIVNNEKEPNNTLMNSDYIKLPNEPIYGYFIKSYSNITIDDTLKPYIKPQNIVDIDCYKVENSTDISTSINIILSDADNADMILFDENFNYLKHGNNNNVSSDFQPKKVYYIVLICYGDKSITKRYSIHYKFN